MRSPVLVLAAWEPELLPLQARLRALPALARQIQTHAVGVGLVEAGIGTATAVHDCAAPPAAIVFIGTAGLYPIDLGPSKGPAIGDAVLVRRACLLSTAVLRGDAYFPGPLPQIISTNATLRAALRRTTRVSVADCACPLGITSRAAAARVVAARTDCALENLEVFAVARACGSARIPFAAVLGITNAVGPRAHRQWKDNAARAAAAAADVLLSWLQRD